MQSDWPIAFLLSTGESEFSDMWFPQNYIGNYGTSSKTKKTH